MLREKYTAEIDTLLAQYAERRSAVLPLLSIAQDEYGYLNGDAVREVADLLNMPYTDVFEVVGFYSLYYDQPVGKWMLQVCDDVPCCYTGAEDLITSIKQRLAIREGETSADGVFTLQRVKCVASCNKAPVVQANLNYIYHVSVEKTDALLNGLRQLAASGQVPGTSGRQAEDYNLTEQGLQLIVRDLGPIEALVPEAPATPEPEKAAQQEEASVAEEPAKEAAERKIEAESPVVADGTNIERPVPERQGEQGVVPANLADKAQPEPPQPEAKETQTEPARGWREGEELKPSDEKTEPNR